MRIKQGLFNSVLVLALAVISTGSTVLANEGSLILPSQADSNIEFALQDVHREIDPAKLMQVFVGPQEACCTGKSPIAGRYSVTDNTVTFDPAFDFITDQRYTVLTRNRNGENNAVSELKEFTLRSASEAVKPEVLMVYPSGPTLPENTLRFYIHFSTPMMPHLAEKFIKLIDSEGNSDTTAFMKFKQELWSKDRRRLTLLMDPGRIKRGVAQNVEQGPALLEGHTYSIVVDGGWPSASGKHESPRFEKVFSVTSALRTLPDTKLWKVESPEISTVKPLVIKFDRPFDNQLAQSSISVFNEGGNVIPGTVTVDENEKIWRFHPEKEWKGASLQIAVDAQFEDVAGNNFKDLLDHSVDTDVKSINQIRFEVALTKASN
jgi:hypothetical protein